MVLSFGVGKVLELDETSLDFEDFGVTDLSGLITLGEFVDGVTFLRGVGGYTMSGIVLGEVGIDTFGFPDSVGISSDTTGMLICSRKRLCC